MNKIMKRVLAGIASAALALAGMGATAATAQADQNQTITFTASTAKQLEGLNLKYYRIATYTQYDDAGSSNHNYELKTAGFTGDAATEKDPATTIRSTIKTILGTNAGKLPDDADPLAWAQSQNPAIFPYDASDMGTNSNNSRKLATALKSLAKSEGTLVTPKISQDDPTQATISVPAGVYVIVDNGSTNPTVPIIVPTGPLKNPISGATYEGKVNIKNTSTPTITKTSDCTTASIGQDCTYTLTTTMPNTTNHDTYTFTVTDTPGKGLTVDPTTVKIGATVATATDVASTSVTPNAAFEGDGTKKMTITLDKTQLEALPITAGNNIVITYTAHLNKDVLSTGSLKHSAKNSVVLNLNGAVSASVDAEIGTSDFSFKKVYGDGAPATTATFSVQDTTTKKYLQKQGADGSWSWGDATHAYNFTADDDGVYTFQGLANGTYRVSETKQADGALYMFGNFNVTIKNSDTVPAQSAVASDPWGLVSIKKQTAATDAVGSTPATPASSVVAVVTNVRTIRQLPLTGAAGIILAVLIAAVLFAGAFVLVSVYRRKAAARR